MHQNLNSRENDRLNELYSYSILDTLPEKEFDDLTAIASQVCDTPVSLITLIDKDRQWYKSRHNLEMTGSHREIAFCAHTINEIDDILIVEDLRLDSRFSQNPLVTQEPNAVFYAGAKLLTKKGFPLGTICVLDTEPRQLNSSQVNALKSLANQVMKLFELKKNNLELKKVKAELEEKNHELERFATLAAHDLKTPLGQIAGMSNLFSHLYSDRLDKEGINLLAVMQNSATSLNGLVDGLLEYSVSDKLARETKQTFDFQSFIDSLAEPFSYNANCVVKINSSLQEVSTSKSALHRIFVNLISNAYKYNNKDVAEIMVSGHENANHYIFSVSDNGPGIAKSDHHLLFKMFEVLSHTDSYGQSGHGIGLSVIKRLLETMGGSITVKSDLNEGATFTFTLPK